jgi:hypothetical protein
MKRRLALRNVTEALGQQTLLDSPSTQSEMTNILATGRGIFSALFPGAVGKLRACFAVKEERLRRAHSGVLITLYLSKNLGAATYTTAIPSPAISIVSSLFSPHSVIMKTAI